ncbi:PHP domain-containing protein [Nakamurella endophytica]|uniref:Phosphatase n=1 Tax=Nakamurella endophytica TaxID=1748367 RepID=A0A917SSP0_9ACTN|nr:PHP domain-containing protein [Nakamurella endophytica]GGL95754.1 phosphatase [Nakamurella endophytica]
MRIDLHAHSTASDGTDSPAELVAAAAAAGLDVLGVTDHDTTGGWAEAEQTRPPGLTVIRGAEFSTSLPWGEHRISVHLLGYLFDPLDPAISAEQDRLREERLQRGMGIVERMTADGIPISQEQVLDIAGDAPVGRPHIGRALVQSGVLRSVDEAFASLLSSRGPYYLPKRDTDLVDAVAMIAAAGGVSVIAHPRGRGESRVLTAERIAGLAESGLRGLEVDHPDHDAAQRAELAELADRHGLIRTGSSDYHGHNKKLRLGQETTDPEQLERVIAAARDTTAPLGPVG